jgi:hypothetical protein
MASVTAAASQLIHGGCSADAFLAMWREDGRRNYLVKDPLPKT